MPVKARTKTFISVVYKRQTVCSGFDPINQKLVLCAILAMLSFKTLSGQGKKNDKKTTSSVLSNPIESVIIFGNSIVKHDPLPSIGWYGDWGMAASKQNLDFVHILMDSIQSKNKTVDIRFKNIALFEKDFDTYNLSVLSQYRTADMIIMNIGENIDPEKAKDSNFVFYFQKLINYLAPTDSTVVIIGESFWPTPVNDIMEEYATNNQRTFVYKSDLFNNKANTAQGLFENEGVANHPSDKGMKNIALRLWNSVLDYFPKK